MFVAVGRCWRQGLVQHEKCGVQAADVARDAERRLRLGLAAGTQRKLQFEVQKLFSGTKILDRPAIPALRLGHFGQLGKILGRFELQPMDLPLRVKRQNAKRRTDHHVFDPLPSAQPFFELPGDGRVTQQRLLLARKRCTPRLLVPGIGGIEQFLNGTRQPEANVSSLLGNKALDQSTVESRNGKLLLDAPGQQDP